MLIDGVKKCVWLAGLLSAAVVPQAAYPASVTLAGTVVNLCVLTLSTPGTLGIAATGTEISSQETGGIAASLSVVATGANPTITFTAPGLSGPSASTTGATTNLSYTSGGGANQSYTGSGYVYSMNRLLDSITVNGRATNSAGFVSGLYTISTTATCSQ